ncbi:MAG: DUF3152 domain-containing protein [Acidimicrobiales bacterium]
MSVVVVAAIWLAGCGTSDVDVAPATTTTTTTSKPTPTTTTTPTTTPTTTTSTPTPTTTTTPTTSLPGGPPELRIDGSPMIRFSVEVGDGVDLTRDEVARFVADTLRDERSWVGRGVGFELLDDGGDFTMIVALPDDVDEMCAPLQTVGRYSCARNGWIAFNSLRWFGATDDWPTDLETYRHYLVNHEVGHYIVGPDHESCPGVGEVAPVMMQQTKGLDGCLPNGWVDP